MLLRKMLRDMHRGKMQFVSIFLMSFLGVFIFTGIGGEWYGLKMASDDFYRDTNLADVWLYGQGFSRKDAEAVKAVGGVTEVEPRLSVKTVGEQFDNKPVIALIVIRDNTISKPERIRGVAFSTAEDGVWLSDRFAEAKGLQPGDSLTLSYEGTTLTKIIKGTVMSPESVYSSGNGDLSPNFGNFGYAYLPANSLPHEGELPATELLVDTKRTDDAALEKEIADALGGKYSVYLPRTSLESYAQFQNEIKQHQAMGSVLPIAFLAIALLTILTTMTRMVSIQRIQIGTLKAIGFSKRSILLHYVSYGFWLSLIGSLLGALLGPLTLPRLFYPSMSAFYTLPRWEPAQSPLFYGMALMTVLVSTLTTYFACRELLQGTTAEALRPKAPLPVKRGWLEKAAVWGKVGFNTRWNIRDMSRSRIRSLMAVVGVLSCMALLVCAFGMRDSMNDVKTWQYDEINRFTAQLTVEEKATPEQIAAVQTAVSGEAIMESPVELRVKGVKSSGLASITDQVTLLGATDPSRNEMKLPADGISISYKLAKKLNVRMGDEIEWHLYGQEKWNTAKIAAIYRTPVAQGITMSRAFYEQQGSDFRPTALLTAEQVDRAYLGIASVWSKSDLIDGWDQMTDSINIMVVLLIFFAVLLAIVVLYNLGLLSFTEKERELATLKVIGFSSRWIRGLLLTQNIWLSVLGILLGIPAGIGLLALMIHTAGDSFDMMIVIQGKTYLLSILLTLIVSVTVNRMFSRKIRSVDMVGSLKGVD
ncbi:ABC transporter permease [Gorillibacterium timonense]|uniref:ABC transporter permease n=1 Tax=Gorillibacterium timonense TaxID=1689269 RepID=UPI00071CEF42|nr:ABC transporter permease [Gorillibacterium timonense]